MKWASEGEKGRTKYMANVDEKAFIKKTKHTNKRAGFDVNQANYLGDNFKKKNEVAAAHIKTRTSMSYIQMAHNNHPPHIFIAFTFEARMLHKNANAISMTYIHTPKFFLWTSILAVHYRDPIPPLWI